MRDFCLFAGLLMALSACESAPKQHPAEQIVPAERETGLAEKLDRNLDHAYGAWHDRETEGFLAAMLSRLLAANPALSKELAGARIHMIASPMPYIAAGLAKTVYLSKGVVMEVFYENELAFLVAEQLALLRDKAATRSLASLETQELGTSLITLPTAPPAAQRDFLEKDWFEPGGLFDFGAEVYLKAEREGIRIAQSAGYDPRGAISLIQRWGAGPEGERLATASKILPEPEERLGAARDEVAKLSPKRDAIVKSQAFEDLQGHLRARKAKKKKSK